MKGELLGGGGGLGLVGVLAILELKGNGTNKKRKKLVTSSSSSDSTSLNYFAYLDSQAQIRGNVGTSSTSDGGVLEGVDVQEVSRLGGELNSASAVRSASLHKEGVVVLHDLPDQSRGHFPSIYNHCY